jgi:sterol desaturase/sphingolipid hydroxylase (fatty acid hydroxylase superfamily)
MSLRIKILSTIIATLLSFLPIFLYLIAKYFYTPDEFWWKVIVSNDSFRMFGMAQFLMFLFWLLFMAIIWLPKFKKKEDK